MQDVTETALAERALKEPLSHGMFSGSDKLLKYDFRAGTGYWHFRSVRGVCGAALALSVSPIIFVGMVMFQMNTHMMLEFFYHSCLGVWGRSCV